LYTIEVSIAIKRNIVLGERRSSSRAKVIVVPPPRLHEVAITNRHILVEDQLSATSRPHLGPQVLNRLTQSPPQNAATTAFHCFLRSLLDGGSPLSSLR
jgi:hypothetical protein